MYMSCQLQECSELLICCIYIYIYIYTCVNSYIYIYIHICIYTYMHSSLSLSLSVYIYIYIYIYIHTHIHPFVAYPPLHVPTWRKLLFFAGLQLGSPFVGATSGLCSCSFALPVPVLVFVPGETTRRGDTIVQHQMFAQAYRGHRTDQRAQPGGTTPHHPEGPTGNLREHNNHSRAGRSHGINYGPHRGMLSPKFLDPGTDSRPHGDIRGVSHMAPSFSEPWRQDAAIRRTCRRRARRGSYCPSSHIIIIIMIIYSVYIYIYIHMCMYNKNIYIYIYIYIYTPCRGPPEAHPLRGPPFGLRRSHVSVRAGRPSNSNIVLVNRNIVAHISYPNR